MNKREEQPDDSRRKFQHWAQAHKHHFMSEWKDGQCVDYTKSELAWAAWQSALSEWGPKRSPEREAGWLPMDNDAKQGQTVIIGGYIHGVWTVMQDDWYSDREMSDWREWPGVMEGKPTHYMPMPTPPAYAPHIEADK